MVQPAQQLNQFGQKPLKGEVAAIPNPVTLSAQIPYDSASTLYAGDAVRLMSGASSTILVDTVLAAGVTFGFIIRNPKKSSFTAGDAVEVALPNSVILLEGYSTISRGNQVEWYPTGHQVRASQGTNPIVGTCLDTCSATGDLIRILVRTVLEYSSSSSSRSSSSSSRSSSSSSSSSKAS
jgi:hypothetical protein